MLIGKCCGKRIELSWRRTILAALGVFVVAAILRCVFPEASLFSFDARIDVNQGRAILAGERVLRGPTAGISYVGLGPLYYYLVALGLLPRNNPLDAVLFVNLLHAAGVGVFCMLFQRMFGARVGVAIGLLLALHPGFLLNGRGLGNPVPGLLASATFVLGIWLLAVEKRSFGWAALMAGAAALPHFHAALILLIPMAAVLLVPPRPRPRGLFLVLGLCVAAVLTVPWILGEVGEHVSAHRSIHELIASLTPPPPPTDYGSVSYPVALFRALTMESTHSGLSCLDCGMLDSGCRVAGFLFSGLVALGVVRCIRGKNRTRVLILIWGAFFPAVVLSLIPFQFHVYYLELTIPFRVALAVIGTGLFAATIRPLRSVLVFCAAMWAVGFVATLHRDVTTGIREFHPGVADLRCQHDSNWKPACNVTLGSKRSMAIHLNAWKQDSPLRRLVVVGPWRLFFNDHAAFWVPSGTATSRERPCGCPSPDPKTKPAIVLVTHQNDSYPKPTPSQIRASREINMFTTQIVESLIQTDPWMLRFPEEEHGIWRRIPGGLPIRPSPRLPEVHRVQLRGTIRIEAASTPPVARRDILIQTTGYARTRADAVFLDGKELTRVDSWMRNELVVDTFLIPESIRGPHELTVHAVNGRPSYYPFLLDVYDVWR